MKALNKTIAFLSALAVGIVATYFFQFNNTVSVSEVLPVTTVSTETGPFQVVKTKSIERTSPSVVQSETVDFPKLGKVTVQAIEQDGKFPLMRFISQTSGKILLESRIQDPDKMLLHEVGGPDSFWELRFRTVEASGVPGPIVMSVGLRHGGSDNGYYLAVFAEIDGKLHQLNRKPFVMAIQGGFYFGELNKKLGDGLAVWGFIWGRGIDEAHYSDHRYALDVYQIRGTRLVRTMRKVTKKMYPPDQSFKCLYEFGITGKDQRLGIPVIGESVDADP